MAGQHWLTDKAAQHTLSQCPGSLIAVHASSPAHAQFGAATGRRPPPPGHCINLARPHCEETATALQTQPCRNQCGHWSPLYAGTAHSCSGLVPPGPLAPSPQQVPVAATSLAHPRLCQSVLCTPHTSTSDYWDFVQCTMHHHLPSPPAWPSTDSSLHPPSTRPKLLQVTVVSSPPCRPEHSTAEGRCRWASLPASANLS